ncbi:MAG: hypothetical protein V4732_18490 [Pseudomonadota bacterium]
MFISTLISFISAVETQTLCLDISSKMLAKNQLKIQVLNIQQYRVSYAALNIFLWSCHGRLLVVAMLSFAIS